MYGLKQAQHQHGTDTAPTRNQCVIFIFTEDIGECVGQQLANSWPTVDRQLTDCWPTVGRHVGRHVDQRVGWIRFVTITFWSIFFNNIFDPEWKYVVLAWRAQSEKWLANSNLTNIQQIQQPLQAKEPALMVNWKNFPWEQVVTIIIMTHFAALHLLLATSIHTGISPLDRFFWFQLCHFIMHLSNGTHSPVGGGVWVHCREDSFWRSYVSLNYE